jgi:hypothetical protein
MPRDHEVLVGGVGVHARHRSQERPGERGYAVAGPGDYPADLVPVHDPVDGLRCADPTAAEEGRLDAAVRAVDGRESVELHARRVLPDEDRVPFGPERVDPTDRREPALHLPLHPERDAEAGK